MMRARSTLLALLVSLPASAEVTGGLSVGAGAAWHDQYPEGPDPVAAARVWLGPRFKQAAILLIGQFAWTREENGDEEYPSAGPVHFMMAGVAYQYEVGRFAIQFGGGLSWKRIPHSDYLKDGASIFGAASLRLWGPARLDLCATRSWIGSEDGITSVTGGIGISF